jgi:hypothetical protein
MLDESPSRRHGHLAEREDLRREVIEVTKKSSGSGKARSAITGRYVKPATAARHPRTTVVEKSPKSGK